MDLDIIIIFTCSSVIGRTSFTDFLLIQS